MRSVSENPRLPGIPSRDQDVVIAGASVAGCRAALTLASKGVGVHLLDRAEFPRWKPCAGGLTLKARPYLPQPLFERVECTIRGACLTFGDEYVTRIRSENPLGWTVHRESFDQTHLELASAQPGVEVSLGTTVREVREGRDVVEVETDRGTLRTRLLIGADGAKSVVSRILPGHEAGGNGFAYEGEVRAQVSGTGTVTRERASEGIVVPGDQATGKLTHGGEEPDRGRPGDEALFDFHTFPRGYGWVFPKEDHYSVGGFVFEGKLPGIKEIYQDFCLENAWLQGAETYRARGHPTALAGEVRPLTSRRILLAGEAGGLVDPLTGEGIYYALRSGHLAGEAAAGLLRDGRPLDLYGDQIRREIQDDLRYARLLARLIYRHPALAFRILLRNALLCRWFVEVGAGVRTYRSLVGAVISKGLALPFHRASGREMEVRVQLPPAQEGSDPTLCFLSGSPRPGAGETKVGTPPGAPGDRR